MIRNSLSIFNSKCIIKIIIRIISSVLVILILGASINTLNWVYFEEEPWNRIMWKSFYEQDNIDIAFIGSSHVYCDVNPFILDELNGMNNFNLSAGSLTLSASYYLLRETDRIYDLTNAYIELYYIPNSGTNSASSEFAMRNNWRSSDYLKPSLLKYEFQFINKDSSRFLETLVPFVRYRANLFDGEFIRGVSELKNSEDWKEYRYRDESETGITEYIEKGIYKTNRTIESTDSYLFETPRDMSVKGLMTDDNCEYMRKIADYCKTNDINLKFFVSPIYETQILSSRVYDSYYKQIFDVAQKCGVELYDFNLCKSEYLDIMHQDFFCDNGHLNETGANKFTPFLWKVLSNTYEDNKEYFCESYAEKISLDAPELYGIYYEDSEEGKSCTFASNTDSELEYYIEFLPEEGEKVVIRDFGLDKHFIIPNDIGGGRLCVKARDVDSKEIITYFEQKYG